MNVEERMTVVIGQCQYNKQVAVALYKLCCGTGSLERDRIALNIGKGTVQQYLWRTINLLARLAPQYTMASAGQGVGCGVGLRCVMSKRYNENFDPSRLEMFRTLAGQTMQLLSQYLLPW